MMEILISRILKYLNGCLNDDYMYRIGSFVVKNYHQICCYDFSKFIAKAHCTQEEALSFFKHLGLHSYEEFHEQMNLDKQLRLDQIKARMLHTHVDKFLSHLNIKFSKEEFLNTIDEICDLIFQKKRVVIVGALYPSSIAVDFQTDLITLGKEVIEYHHFDKSFQFNEDDVVFFITATGRTMEYNAKKMVKQNLCDAYVVLVTQNMKYIQFENVCPDYVVHVLGTFDGLEFSYQTMMILDLMRIRYYEKFYLEEE